MKLKAWWTYRLLGSVFILLAFFVGAQTHFLFGLVGFLAFFVVGVTLIIEGQRQAKK